MAGKKSVVDNLTFGNSCNDMLTFDFEFFYTNQHLEENDQLFEINNYDNSNSQGHNHVDVPMTTRSVNYKHTDMLGRWLKTNSRSHQCHKADHLTFAINHSSLIHVVLPVAVNY